MSSWAEVFYFNHPQLYLPVMENNKEAAIEEAIQINEKIFKEFFPPNKKLKVLDLCCGIGTHALTLASIGHEVVGYDFSPHCIERAKKWATEKKLDEEKIRFYQGDIREVSRFLIQNQENDFDVILNLGTAHGFYGEDEDRKLFKELLSFAAPGCVLIIGTVNKDWILKHGTPYGFDVIKGTRIQVEQKRNLNLETSTLENEWKYQEILPQGGTKQLLDLQVNHRIYAPHELAKLLTDLGWIHLKSYGSLEKLESSSPEYFRMSIIAKKE
jgi:2-polyprenyl-3-methyl-5-hydroxy-6-metoxy-1,4-benzoquinol methylase